MGKTQDDFAYRIIFFSLIYLSFESAAIRLSTCYDCKLKRSKINDNQLVTQSTIGLYTTAYSKKSKETREKLT